MSSKKLCKFCKPNQAFKTEFALKRHNFEEHQIGENNPLICQICGFGFDGDLSEEQLSRIVEKHSNAHDRGKNFSCMFCPEVFKTARSLEEHHFRHLATSARQNRCKSCQSSFTTSDDLQAHLCSSECKENHEKPFRCYICQENFAMGITKKKHVQEEHADKAGADCPLCLRCKIPSALAYENHFKTHFAGEFEIFLSNFIWF